MKFIKYLIFSGFFCISTTWANMNNEGVFVELTSEVGGSPYGVSLSPGGGVGYKYNSPNENYFGYFQGSFNFNMFVHFKVGSSSYKYNVQTTSGVFDFEYGYEFRKEHSFSYGVSISPIIPTVRYELKSKDKNNRLSIDFTSLLKVFGNIKINDSFLISIEGKGKILAWQYFIRRTLKKEKVSFIFHPLFPIPFVEVKGKYFFK